jgi:hypothetical protein
MKPLRQESFGVFPFSSKTMHDHPCSQGFLGIQDFVQKQKSYWCLSKPNVFWKFKRFLRKVTIHLENLKKKKHHEVNPKQGLPILSA